MPPQLTDDQTLCLAANSRRSGQELSEVQRMLLRLVAHYERVGDVVGASGLPKSLAESELVRLLEAGWLARLEPVEGGNSSASVELAVSSGSPATAQGYSLLEDGEGGAAALPGLVGRATRSALRPEPSLAPSTARLGSELERDATRVSPPVGMSRVVQVKAVLGERVAHTSASQTPPTVASPPVGSLELGNGASSTPPAPSSRPSPALSSRPPVPTTSSTLRDLAWTHSVNGGETLEASAHVGEQRISDVEGKRVSRPAPLVSEIQGLRPEPVLAQQAVGAGAPAVSDGMVVGKLRVPRPGEVHSPTKAEKAPGTWEKEDRLPSVRINRKPSPPAGFPAAHRVVTVGARDATSDAPVAPAGERELEAPRLSPAPAPRGHAGALAAAANPRQRTPGEMPAVREPGEPRDPEPEQSHPDAAPRRAAPNRELGRTLLGGHLHSSDAAARVGTSDASGEVRSPSGRVGISRMVVVGKSDPALAATPAAPPGPQTVRISAPATLLGVRAPNDAELELPVAGNSFAAPPANQTAEPEPEENLDHYEVIERLAMGGNGVVYRVRDPRAATGEYLALKVLRQGQHKNPEAVSALTLEAKLMGAFEHPNLVQLHDFGHENDEPFLLMECIDGLTMSELLHHPVSLPLDVGLIILQDALEALDYVHNVQIEGEAQRGVIHCDVSPQNLLVGRDGRTRLIDFGTSRSPGSPIGEQVVRCKPRYASPELLAGEAVDATTDVFAVGAVLFQLLCKQPAFSADPARRKRESLVPNPSRLNSRAPTRFDPICQRALDADRSKRYASAREMLDELNQAVELSGIVLRRERVRDWVERAVQAREGEVQLGPEEVQELLAEGRRPRRASSSDTRQAIQVADREHTRDLHSSPESTPISTLPPAAETVLLTRTTARPEGLPAKLRQWLTAAALVVAGAVVALALFSPATFQSIVSPVPSGGVEPGMESVKATPSTLSGPTPNDALPTTPRTMDALPGENAGLLPSASGVLDPSSPTLEPSSAATALPPGSAQASPQVSAPPIAAAPKAAKEARPTPVRRATPAPAKPPRPPEPVVPSPAEPDRGSAEPDAPAPPQVPTDPTQSADPSGNAPAGSDAKSLGVGAPVVDNPAPTNSVDVTP